MDVSPIDVTGVPAVEGIKEEAAVAAPETTPEQPKDDAATRFAQLARREKMVRARAREIEAKEAALKAREAELLGAKPQVDESWKERFKSDPASVLAEAGMSYDQLVEHMLTQNPTDQSVKWMQQELKAMKAQQQQLLQQMQEREEVSMKQALNQLKFDIKNMITGNKDEYEALAASGETGYDMVVKLIRETFEADKTIMDMEEAAREVEEYLTDRYVELAKLKKIQTKLTPTQQAAQAEVKQQQSAPAKVSTTPAAAKQTNTLSHTMAPSSRAATTERERKQRAILAFEGKLQG